MKVVNFAWFVGEDNELKDLSENEQQILKNEQKIEKTLSAIWGLLHQGLEKQTKSKFIVE